MHTPDHLMATHLPVPLALLPPYLLDYSGKSVSSFRVVKHPRLYRFVATNLGRAIANRGAAIGNINLGIRMSVAYRVGPRNGRGRGKTILTARTIRQTLVN